MAPSKEVVRILKAYVDTDEGVVAVPKGEPLPSNALDGETDRLRALGALGSPESAAPAEEGDEVTALAASMTEESITDYVRDTPVKEIVAAVGDDAELASRVLTAESDATGGEPRSSLEKALQKVIDEAGRTEPQAGTEAKPKDNGDAKEPVDYSAWKAPEIKAELTKRGIEFKPVGVKNADLIALLKADDKKSA